MILRFLGHCYSLKYPVNDVLFCGSNLIILFSVEDITKVIKPCERKSLLRIPSIKQVLYRECGKTLIILSLKERDNSDVTF